VLIAAVVLVAAVLMMGCPKPQTVATPPAAPPSASTSTYDAPAASTPAEAKKPQTAADPKHMTELEQKHVPQFALPTEIRAGKPVSVTVNVGQVPHPMTAKHYIQWVELYVDGTSVGKVDLKPGDKPMATFEITPTKSTHTLKADINCNIHGLWENTEDITAM
jgi:desulfoferrodoxin-like iron-binding protein